jgi:hypothetical protein
MPRCIWAFPVWWLGQGIAQVELFIRHTRAESSKGKLLRIALSWWQLVIEASYPLLEYPASSIPHQTTHWLSTMRDFLSDMNADLFGDGVAESIPQPLRQGDVCLMDAILSVPGTSTAHLRAFNRCRIFFGMVFVSELATTNGTRLSREAWEGARTRVSPLLWLYQPKPGPKSFLK